jgi:hypothetical protein
LALFLLLQSLRLEIAGVFAQGIFSQFFLWLPRNLGKELVF